MGGGGGGKARLGGFLVALSCDGLVLSLGLAIGSLGARVLELIVWRWGFLAERVGGFEATRRHGWVLEG